MDDALFVTGALNVSSCKILVPATIYMGVTQVTRRTVVSRIVVNFGCTHPTSSAALRAATANPAVDKIIVTTDKSTTDARIYLAVGNQYAISNASIGLIRERNLSVPNHG